ncbi:MAG: CHC2 zinc finger domain-containing protein [Myxococcota bacterium]|nr:CHC2 zinc finger domain-containing protein [Myxococcota bacterium]
MARIPKGELERLKREVSLERLAEARGVKLERHGADLLGLCPFHDDHEPSLVITPRKNLWHCLGACQAGGSVIDWVMRAEGISFRHAAELLRADLPPEGLTKGKPPERSTAPKLPGLLDASEDDQVLLRRVVDYYHAALKESPEALAYLASRGLQHAEAVERFQLGFANRTLGYRLPAKNRKEGAAIRERLQALGVIRSSGHEHLNGSLVVPVFDEEGRVAELYGRKITPRLRPGTPLHLYLPGPHRGVWNIEALQASREIILCESLLDALTFWCAGFRNVTAAYGTEGMTPDHWKAFERYGTERVLLAHDRDEAGEKAAEKLASQLTERGIGAYRIHFPKGMDANETALKLTPATKSLELLIRKATWLGKGKASAPSTTATPMPAAKEEALEEDEPEAPPEIVAETPPEPSPVEEPLLPLAATPEPAPPPQAPPAEERGEELVMTLGDRRWRIRGLAKNTSFDALRVNVLVAREGQGFHVDTLDLYSARHRKAYLGEAASELGLEERVLKKDLGQVLLRLEALQEEQIQKATEPKEKTVELDDDEREAALALLRDPGLLDRILADFTRCGVVGEETNKLVGYLAAVSRKLEEPLAVVIQSSSAAGKSSLMEAVLAFMPEEERVQYSAMTGQSLFYMGETDLRHKILAIVEEEGAERASYALKLLQSEGQLTIASTGKDPSTGRLITHEYRVEGPVMIFLTTTAIEIDEELLNRCLVLTVNEDREQTRAIHRLQRERQTLEGLLERQDREYVLKVHRDAQRLLRPLLVANPFARSLTFLDHQTRTRRDHMKYLTLIRSVALLQQYQRPVKTAHHHGRAVRYIEVTRADVATANRLAHEVLGRSLDELPPQTRRLLGLLSEMVTKQAEAQGLDRCDVRFTRREVREATGWSDFPVRMHLEKLTALEYLLVHRGGPGQRFVYELLYDGQGEAGEAFLTGLLDAEALASHEYDANCEHPEPDCEPTLSPARYPLDATLSLAEMDATPGAESASPETASELPESTTGERKNAVTVVVTPSLAAARSAGAR